MLGDNEFVAADALLLKLKRLMAKAGETEKADRRLLLALIDDVEKTRRDLLRERDRIEDEMKRGECP
ncbi:hypothetical protein [Bradyrhizobium sp.]|uniref:hypothetical protein n=1 Tax=Bradyrhizobium sp. TaxID=376 RepID=UPI0039E54083